MYGRVLECLVLYQVALDWLVRIHRPRCLFLGPILVADQLPVLVLSGLGCSSSIFGLSFVFQGEMVQKGTYTEFQKSGIDFGSLLKKENDEAEHSPLPGTPMLRKRTISESSVWSQQSSRPSLKDGGPESQEVSPLTPCPVSSLCGLLGPWSLRDPAILRLL